MQHVYAKKAAAAIDMAAYLAMRSFVHDNVLCSSKVHRTAPCSGCYGALTDPELAGLIELAMHGR